MARKSPTKRPDRPGPKGGRLQTGNPGNRGGSGRPPSMIRERLRGSFADRIATLEQIADGEAILKMKVGDGKTTELVVSADVADRIKAIDMLAKYGLGTVKEVTVENVRERVLKTLDVIRARTSPEQSAQIIADLRPIWV